VDPRGRKYSSDCNGPQSSAGMPMIDFLGILASGATINTAKYISVSASPHLMQHFSPSPNRRYLHSSRPRQRRLSSNMTGRTGPCTSRTASRRRRATTSYIQATASRASATWLRLRRSRAWIRMGPMSGGSIGWGSTVNTIWLRSQKGGLKLGLGLSEFAIRYNCDL